MEQRGKDEQMQLERTKEQNRIVNCICRRNWIFDFCDGVLIQGQLADDKQSQSKSTSEYTIK